MRKIELFYKQEECTMKEYFKDVKKIKYEGPKSDNPLSFKHYNPDEVVGDRTMREHLKFSVAYWHTFTAEGTDPFGAGTMLRPWNHIDDPMDKAKARMEAAFEFFDKLGVDYFCFHDRDIAPEGNTLAETNKNLDQVADLAKQLMKDYNIKLLWGTANTFNNPRFVHGAATSCNADVFAYTAAQIKKAIDVTHALGGEGYTFWGGREGYETLLNTNMKLELDNYARLLHMAVDYAKKIGFEGQFYIEPKPKEPTKHQYDFDAAAVVAFLKTYDLDDHFKLNIETNHATLAGHTMQHELRYARINDMLGSIDANQGDLHLGWDTDQFPTDIYVTTLVMYEVLQSGGFTTGGLNFDAKVRRPSFEPVDLFYAHIVGMDSFAKGLKIAYKMKEDGKLDKIVADRYESYTKGIGKDIVSGKADFVTLEEYALKNNEITNSSGRQEYLEWILNEYILGD